MTEEQIRAIVREEIEKALAERSQVTIALNPVDYNFNLEIMRQIRSKLLEMDKRAT